MILELLQKAQTPMTRRELCRLSVPRGVNASTVYRTLRMLTAEGLVAVSENSRHEPCFELARERHHHHLRCNVCGRSEDVRCHMPAQTLRRWEREYRYRITGHAGDVFGVCGRCAAKERRPS